MATYTERLLALQCTSHALALQLEKLLGSPGRALASASATEANKGAVQTRYLSSWQRSMLQYL
jgi:hypothetical protein